MKNIRWLAVAAAMIIVAPSLADARAGAGSDTDRAGFKADGAERRA